LNDFAAFAAFAVLWSAGAGLMLKTGIQPLAIFAVWTIGFIWGAAYILAGKRSADLLLKRWFQLMIGAALVGGTLSLMLS
jgi:hypothetical protein